NRVERGRGQFSHRCSLAVTAAGLGADEARKSCEARLKLAHVPIPIQALPFATRFNNNSKSSASNNHKWWP
uniref:DUF982 domain-containing protein n=1 Tax=Mesocestoides corti TaxID=53468 RepID=A0A5K3FU59_MESCO